jgi:hypothetical protein
MGRSGTLTACYETVKTCPMTNEMIEVQGPVSRPDSVRHRLADAAWLSGASAFVANGVPFSFTTGPVLAECVCELVAFLAEETLEQSITLHDAGAGTGYLTRHVIEALERRDPDLARACRYVASDSSAESVNEMVGVFSELQEDLQGRVTARTGNALSPNDILDGGPSVVLMSYLMDAVPPVHVARFGDEVHEVLVQTWVAAGERVVDGSTWPPRVLEGEELAEVLRSSPESLSPGAALQVLPLIIEAAVEGPLLDDGITHAGSGTPPAPFFNTRPGAVTAITDFVTRLDEESIVLVTDFGYSGTQVPSDFDVLMTEYGATACYAVFFDELGAAAVAAGATCCLRSGEAGGTHTLAIYKGVRKAAFQDRFEAAFGEMDPDRDESIPFNLSEGASLEEVQAEGRRIKETVTPGELPAYANLANLAHLMAAYSQDGAAHTYATDCDARYGLIAAPEQLLLGDLATRRGDSDVALEWYERACKTASTYGPSHVKVAEIYLSLSRYENYVAALKAYIYVTDVPVWAHLAWLNALGEDIPEEVPDDVRREFQEICQAEFGRNTDSDGDGGRQ